MTSGKTPGDSRPDLQTDFGYRILRLLEGHGLGPSPIHYWIFHDYLQAANEELVKAVSEQLSAGRKLDSFVLHGLFERYVAGESLSRFSGMGDELEALLRGVISLLRNAERNTADFHESLTDNLQALDQADHPEGLKAIAQRLAAAVVTASSDNRALQKNLEEAELEARHLRHELEKHRKESITDPLTGLFNRRGMETEMARVLMAADELCNTMLVMDIDHFKSINDRYGHAVGDVVIRKVAASLRRVLPADAVLVRFGGEEFVALLSGYSVQEAVGLAEQAREVVERLRLVNRQDDTVVEGFTISAGVAPASESDTVETLFARADKALYQAKHTGRNRVVVASG
ncbi:diguanylate cyclase [Ectothiorhodospira sp. PHS-1]|uniref:GGDEF domain-containing protein n=1 Tax=Ectothiorhodospira sp. PHS-1 TaxID=519989 RepID=UPI00024A88BB|nr:GGDEF domain-containing protein [Ectothiorhodospira sp. PHS-1]EHQ51293.1 diguanylate cyclase [Ectothiorhodospira sp. PHS-1]